MAKKQAPKATLGQKIVFFTIMIFGFPFSLIYLIVWRGRCVNCGKRITFNKHVCKKCMTRSMAIVEDFDSKMEQFFAQMQAIDIIEDIFDQYGYIIDRIEEIDDIYEALDEKVDYVGMKHKVVDYLEQNCEHWLKNQTVQLKKNIAYKEEVLAFLATEAKEHVEFILTADSLIESINAIESE